MKNETFTVIVPCYNVECYVVDCVESLQEQTYSNLEILLIDDGSTDQTFDLCKKMAEKYQNVTAITHKAEAGKPVRNQGLEETRNLGLDTARGKWIFFLDADDTLEKNTFEEAKKIFDTNEEIDFILMGLSLIFNSEKENVNLVADLPEGIFTGKEIADAFLTKIPWAVISCVGTKIYRRDFIENHGFRFEKCYKYNEDGAFAVKAFYAAKKIAHRRAADYKYLQRENSLMHSYRPGAFPSLNAVVSLLESYFGFFGIDRKKAFYIYRMRLGIVWVLLQEEAKYKTKKEFDRFFQELSETEDVIQTCKKLDGMPKTTGREKIKVFLIKNRWRPITYVIFKIIDRWKTDKK